MSTTLIYSVIQDPKFNNHISLNIDDNKSWIEVKSYIWTHTDMKATSEILKNHINTTKLLIRLLNLTNITLLIKDAHTSLYQILHTEFSNIQSENKDNLVSKDNINVGFKPSVIAETLIQENNNDNTVAEQIYVKPKNTSAIADNKDDKPKPLIVVDNNKLSENARKLLEIMKRANGKWPDFSKEMSKQRCLNYIRNNLNGINNATTEYVYGEISKFLKLNPSFVS